ncbi:MAG: 4Fe-4S dicluster domain-containing protein [Elusimicrobiota bacterium]
MAKPAKMLGELLGGLFTKPATVLYPFERLEVPPRFRGRIAYEAASCIGCKLCMRDCPSDAIRISKYEGGSFLFAFVSARTGERKLVEIPNNAKKRHRARFRLSRCIYCAQCVESCPKKCLRSTDQYELAVLGSNIKPPKR